MEFGLLAAALVAMASVYATLRFVPPVGRLRPDPAGFDPSVIEDDDPVPDTGEPPDRVPENRLWDSALAAVLGGVLVGRLMAMVTAGVNPLTNPMDVVAVRGGVATGWAALGTLLTLAWVARRDPVPTFDGLSVATLVGLAGWHASCMIRGSCAGTVTDAPWAISVPGSEVLRHPVELYAAVGFLVAAAALTVVIRRRASDAAVPPAALVTRRVPAGLALAAAGGIRLGTEPYRLSLSGGPTGWYLAAIVVGAVVVVAALVRNRTPHHRLDPPTDKRTSPA